MANWKEEVYILPDTMANILQVMDSIAHLIKKENDVLYVMGRREEKQEIITNLLKTNLLSVEQIAQSAGVSVDFVRTVQAGLK